MHQLELDDCAVRHEQVDKAWVVVDHQCEILGPGVVSQGGEKCPGQLRPRHPERPGTREYKVQCGEPDRCAVLGPELAEHGPGAAPGHRDLPAEHPERALEVVVVLGRDHERLRLLARQVRRACPRKPQRRRAMLGAQPEVLVQLDRLSVVLLHVERPLADPRQPQRGSRVQHQLRTLCVHRVAYDKLLDVADRAQRMNMNVAVDTVSVRRDQRALQALARRRWLVETELLVEIRERFVVGHLRGTDHGSFNRDTRAPIPVVRSRPMKSFGVLVVVMATGCFSAGGTVAFNTALDDSAVRRVGGNVRVGSFSEVVEDRLIGQLFYSRDLGPLGDSSNALVAWGAKLTTIGTGSFPGFYAMGAYGQNDALTQAEASSVIAGAGVSYGRMRPGAHGRGFAGLSAGLVFHRQRQETGNHGETGHFLGLAISVDAGFDLIGPMFRTTADDD